MVRKHLNKLRFGRSARADRVFRIFATVGLLLLSIMWGSVAVAQEYEVSEIDTPPKVIKSNPVTYPTLAKRSEIEGKVVVRVLIGVKGKADKMEVVESEPKGMFDEAALKSLKYWKFRPGLLGGELVATWVKIPLSFKLD